MKIHLIRHAEAIPHAAELPEALRYLTSRGRTRFRRVATALKKQGANLDLIVTSPLIRAVQTAEILAETVRFAGDLLVMPRLSPGFSISDLHDILSRFPHCSEIALVGHEPDMGKLVQILLLAPGPCFLKKGGVVSFKTSLVQPTVEPKFLGLITGGGKIVTNVDSALERLQAV